MNDKVIDVDVGTEIAVKVATENMVEQAEKQVFEAGLTGDEFDRAVSGKIAAAQPALATYAATVRTWLLGGAIGRLRLNKDGTAQ